MKFVSVDKVHVNSCYNNFSLNSLANVVLAIVSDIFKLRKVQAKCCCS